MEIFTDLNYSFRLVVYRMMNIFICVHLVWFFVVFSAHIAAGLGFVEKCQKFHEFS